MTADTVARVRARYHVPETGARDRLDRLLRVGVARGLAAGKEAAGIGVDELVCVARVAVPVEVALDQPDGGIADALAAEIAARFAAALSDGAGVVRYRSRRVALADLALRVAVGDTGRWWAWRQLGWWPQERGPDPGADRDALHTALCAEPVAAVPVLAGLARRSALARLVAVLGERGVLAVGAAALRSHGVPPAALAGRTDLADPLGAEPAGRAAVAAELAGSHIARAVQAVPELVAGEGARRALAALALLETAPVKLRGAAPDAAAAIATAAALLAGSPIPAGSETRPARGLPSGPAAPATPAPGDVGELAEDPVGARIAGRRPVGRPGSAAPARPIPESEPARPQRAAGRDERAVADALVTDHGGLLFLIPVLDEAGVPDRFGGAAWAQRPYRDALRLLATRLAPVADDDPAALALAGCDPHDPPAPPDSATGAEAAALDGEVAAVVAALERRLPGVPERGSDLLGFVARRRAEVTAEPGGVELRFDPASVSIDIRRAGLDIDPGFVPWLGTVVRYRYA